ncbi:MAG: YkgJ family cysteine cluster protein [Candidatus Omnitrophota bacterium]
MSSHRKKSARKKVIKTIDCSECKTQADCCQTGAWVDLEEAKKIATLGLKGEFFQLETDSDFPSGYRIGTSYGYNPCSFLDSDGLCSIHKLDYSLKPKSCKEFPYENNSLSPVVDEICTLFKAKMKIKNKNIDK